MPVALPVDADQIINEAIEMADTLHGKLGSGAYNCTAVRSLLKPFQASMDADELFAALPDVDDLDVRRRALRLIEACDELEHLANRTIRFMWKKNTSVKNDRIILGTAGAVSASEREKWPASAGPAPWFRITLSLAAWLVMPERERSRLLHHEMMHCGVGVDSHGNTRPETVAHDIEENTATVARFGLGDRSQALVVAAAMAHPATATAMKAWFIDPATGQGALWPPPVGQDVVG